MVLFHSGKSIGRKRSCKYAHVLTPRICQSNDIILEYPEAMEEPEKQKRWKTRVENEAEEKVKVDKHKESP